MSPGVRIDYTVTLDGTYIQILRGPYVLPRPSTHVTLRRYLDNSLHIFHGTEELRFEILTGKPAAPRSRPQIMPPPTHPWRRKRPIGRVKRRRYWQTHPTPEGRSSEPVLIALPVTRAHPRNDKSIGH